MRKNGKCRMRLKIDFKFHGKNSSQKQRNEQKNPTKYQKMNPNEKTRRPQNW